MKITRVRGLALLAKAVACSMVIITSTLVQASAGAGWATSFEQARDIARQQGRPIFVDFTTSWCGVCKQMDRTVMADPAIIGRLDNFVKVKVDGDARPDLCSAYGVMAYPTFIHLDPQGRVVQKREGQMRTQEMAKALDSTWQSVAASAASIQANQKPDTQLARATPVPSPVQNRQSGMLLAAADNNKMLPASANASATDSPMPISSAHERLARSTEAPAPRDAPATREVASVNAANDPNRGSVYAMGAVPVIERRSRFGGGASAGQSEGGLRQLAEATAQPGAIEESTKEDTEKTKEEPAKSEKEEPKEVSKEEKPTQELAISSANPADEPSKDEVKKAEPAKETASTEQVRIPYAPPATPDDAAKPATPKAGSAVVESRLSMISGDELPKPMLSRSLNTPTQAMNPGASVSKAADASEALAAIKHTSSDVPAVKPPTQVVSIAPAKAIEKSAVAAEEEPKPTKEAEASKAKSDKPEETEKKTETSKKSEKTETPSKSESAANDKKVSDKATVKDINRWITDADTKLINGHKKEARAMYSKVVENDPKNISGKSDMAYIKMVSLIVDKDSDLQRKEAYQKIRQFEARYPDSDHKDYYTLIRAILAVDLNEITEAHRLLATYAERFPDSKYAKMAHDQWKSLPSLKKDSGSEKSSKSKSSKSSASSSSKKSSSKS